MALEQGTFLELLWPLWVDKLKPVVQWSKNLDFKWEVQNLNTITYGKAYWAYLFRISSSDEDK